MKAEDKLEEKKHFLEKLVKFDLNLRIQVAKA